MQMVAKKDTFIKIETNCPRTEKLFQLLGFGLASLADNYNNDKPTFILLLMCQALFNALMIMKKVSLIFINIAHFIEDETKVQRH